jgi:hypothetical protein
MLKRIGAISLLFCYKQVKIKVLDVIMGFFLCAILISVKSKYGSCSGSCTGLIKNYNNVYVYI